MSDTEQPEEMLVTRREKRSTAGNRMAAALAEMALDDTKEPEDDVEFINDKIEEDISGSDFESTDEEAVAVDADAGDKHVQEEEKKERKVLRTRLARSTAVAHARQKVTFNPLAEDINPSTSSRSPAKKPRAFKKRVASGTVVENVQESGENKRQSKRKHTVMNTSETATRIKQSEARRASALPKRSRVESRTFTQAELIAQALDNEEGNIVEHRDYLMLEEEKRKRAKVVRAVVHGPLLRWVSKAEEVKVTVLEAPPPPPTYTFSSSHRPNVTNTPFLSTSAYYSHIYQATPQSSSVASSSSTPTHYSGYSQPPRPPLVTEKTEMVTKNYVIHELDQYDQVVLPDWGGTMDAMFGDEEVHGVRWEDMRVLTGKNRPMSRPRQTCPVTGRAARYLDPRTGVPFANVNAYDTLSRILKHEFVWSKSLGCYVSHQSTVGALGLKG